MAYAAVDGRKVTFRLATGEPIIGYVVGMDDYHWHVAHTDASQNVVTTLVHKGLAPAVTISPHSTLVNEDSHIQGLVSKIGGGFWRFCQQNYLGKTNPASQEKQPA